MNTLTLGKLEGGRAFELPLDLVTQTVAILAKRGVGKTYTASVMAEEMLGARQPICVLDPTGAWYGLRSTPTGEKGGWPVYIFGGEHGDVPLEEGSGEIIARAIVEQGLSAVLDFSLLRKGQTVRFAAAFLETLYRLNRNPLHLFVDEADAFAPQRCMHEEARLLGAMEDLVRRGRKRGLGCTLITQRPAVLNKNVLTQCEVLVALRLVHPKDIAAIMEWVQVHADETTAAAMLASLPSLPVGTAWFWSPGWGEFFARVQVRERRTFDSGSTPKVGQVAATPQVLAKVDLQKLNAEIQQTLQRVKENDPAELRRKIRELERAAESEKRKAESGKAAGVLTQSREGQAEVAEKIKVAVMSAVAERDAFWRGQYGRALHHLHGQLKILREAREAIAKVYEDGEKVLGLSKEKALATFAASAAPAPMVEHLPGGEKRVTYLARDAFAVAGKTDAGGVGKGGLRRMLIALAQQPERGLTKRQLGVRAGLSSKSGTFGTYLARGRAQGWLRGNGDFLLLTDEGRSARGHYEPLPEGAELCAYWINELGNSGAARMLTVLRQLYPGFVSRDRLGAEAGISPTSGTFGTYLAKLRSLELVVTTAEGLRLPEELAD
ncbi:MAG: DUF87 domain-containing protein [Kiritimatiellaeota bacterium]|nr:DUF87 domain-containing protein [Kiritimatiellota bacterium]